jgi:phage-related protein
MDMQQAPRPVYWIGSSLKDLKEMPEDVQDAVGFSLF